MVVGSVGAAAAAARCGGSFGSARWLGGGSAALLARRQHLTLTRVNVFRLLRTFAHMEHYHCFNSLFSLPLLGVSAQSRDPLPLIANVKVLGLNVLNLKLTRHEQMP